MATNPYKQYLGDGKTLNQSYIRWQEQNPTEEQTKAVSQGGTVPAPTMIGVKFDYTPKTPVAPNSPASWVQEEQAKYYATRTPGTPEVTKPDYTTEYAIRADDTLTKYQRNKLLKEYYTKNKMQFDPNAFPESPEEEAEYFLNQQKQQKTYLEQQVEAAKSKSARQFGQSSAALKSAFAQSREGVTSAGNEMIAPAIISEMEKDRQAQIAQLDQSLIDLKEKQRLQQQSFSEGRQQEIALLEANIYKQKTALEEAETKRMTEARMTAQEAREARQDAIAEIKDLDLSQMSQKDLYDLATRYPLIDKAYLEIKQENDLSKRQTQENKDKVALQKSYMDMFTTNIENGIEMPNSAILAYSKQSGIPAEMFISFNDAAKQIKDMKGVDEAYKQAQLDNLKLDMDRKIKGLDNADIEKFTFIAKLRAAGADEETVSEFMRVAGIKDPNDPYFQALVKNLEADYIKKLNDAGSILAVKDVSGLDNDIGKKVGQCGRYVNNYLGKPGFFGNTYESKTSRINSQTPAVGSVFIYKPTSSNPYGHVGIVKSVNPDGTITAIHSNYHGKVVNGKFIGNEKVSEDDIKMSSITGYYSPKTEASKPDLESAWKTNYELYKKGTLTDSTLRSTMESLGKTSADKQKIREFINDKLSETTKKYGVTKKVLGVPMEYGEIESKTYPLTPTASKQKSEDIVNNPPTELKNLYNTGEYSDEDIMIYIEDEYKNLTSEQRQRLLDNLK